MVELLQALDNYYEVIKKTGYIPLNTIKKLIVLSFIDDLICDPEYSILASCEQKQFINKLYECLINNNCLL